MPAGAWDPWGPVLDDLESRVESAEAGDLAALEGWTPPPAPPRPMDDEAQHRASGILARQRALLSRLREERAEVAAALRTTRRPVYRAAAPVPVYLDRLG